MRSSVIGPLFGWLVPTVLVAGVVWFLVSGGDGIDSDEGSLLGSWYPTQSYEVPSPGVVAGAVTLGPLPVGPAPVGIAADSAGFAFVVRAGDPTVTRIEPVSGSMLPIELGGRPEDIQSDGSSVILRNGTGSLVTISSLDAAPSATPLGFEPLLVGSHEFRTVVVRPGGPPVLQPSRPSDSDGFGEIPLAGAPRVLDGGAVAGTSVLLDGAVQTLAEDESAGTQPVPPGTVGLVSTSQGRYVWGPDFVGVLAPPGVPYVDPILPIAGVESVAADSTGVWIATRDGRLTRWSDDLRVPLGRVDGVGRRPVLASTANDAVWVLDRESATVRLVRPRADLGDRAALRSSPPGATAPAAGPGAAPAPRPAG